MWEDFIKYLGEAIDTSGNPAEKILYTALLLGIIFFIRHFAYKAAGLVFSNEKIRRRVSRIAVLAITIGAALGIILLWFNALNSLFIIAVILAVILLFSMRELIVNVFSFFYIRIVKPFTAGDRIEIAGTYGDVEEISLFKITLIEVRGWLHTATPTGRLIHIPNRSIFNGSYANESNAFPYVWRDLEVPITHQSNLEKAFAIVQAAGKRELDLLVAKDHAQKERLESQAEFFNSNLLPQVTMRVDGNGVCLTLRYLTRNTEMAASETRLWKYIYHRFAGTADIDYSPAALAVQFPQAQPDFQEQPNFPAE